MSEEPQNGPVRVRVQLSEAAPADAMGEPEALAAGIEIGEVTIYSGSRV